ncbi:MAG: hypothetical protein J07HX64_00891 [halophilic archaeon J07HX64]|nr:MAG: hypothetical protein J07HX64_00891 [halophilic archaeon J07HX64]
MHACDQVADVLERVRQLYLQAKGQGDAVKRAGAFIFARQRELTEDLERVECELKTVTAEPVGQVNETTAPAGETDDPDTTVEWVGVCSGFLLGSAESNRQATQTCSYGPRRVPSSRYA